MDFSTTFSNADKRSMLQRALAAIENEIHEASWRIGIDPDDLSVDFKAVADEYGNKNLNEVALEGTLSKWSAAKAKLESL